MVRQRTARRRACGQPFTSKLFMMKYGHLRLTSRRERSLKPQLIERPPWNTLHLHTFRQNRASHECGGDAMETDAGITLERIEGFITGFW